MNSGSKQMETKNIIITGYGSAEDRMIAEYQIEQSGEYQKLWQTSIPNASFVCKDDEYLFTVSELDEYGIIYMLRREAIGYKLIDRRRVEGGALCHITFSVKHKTLYGACYGTGTVFAVRVQEQGFGEILYSEIQHNGDQNELTRAHCVLLNHHEDELLTINIALDQIICYRLEVGVPVLSRTIALPKGVGPRHVIYSEDETYLYVITEYSNEIFVLENESGKLLQRISTLPESYEGVSNCSTLCFSKDGKYLYGANRGADTIVQFAVNAQGELRRMKEYPCGGKHPRHMIRTKIGDMLIICNQNSNQVVAYLIEEKTGELIGKAFELEFLNPSGITEV